MDNRNFALRIDLPPLPVSTPARPLPPGAALPDLGALRAAAPPARPAGVSFGGQLVDALLRSLSGSATPPGSLQLQLQWQSPATAYAPPLPTPLTLALPTPAAPQPPGAGTAPPTHPAPLPTAPARPRRRARSRPASQRPHRHCRCPAPPRCCRRWRH